LTQSGHKTLRVSSLKQWIADDSFIEVELSNVRFTVRRMGPANEPMIPTARTTP